MRPSTGSSSPNAWNVGAAAFASIKSRRPHAWNVGAAEFASTGSRRPHARNVWATDRPGDIMPLMASRGSNQPGSRHRRWVSVFEFRGPWFLTPGCPVSWSDCELHCCLTWLIYRTRSHVYTHETGADGKRIFPQRSARALLGFYTTQPLPLIGYLPSQLSQEKRAMILSSSYLLKKPRWARIDDGESPVSESD